MKIQWNLYDSLAPEPFSFLASEAFTSTDSFFSDLVCPLVELVLSFASGSSFLGDLPEGE